MKRIYLAGSYSSDNIIGCLNNIHDGIRAAVDVLLFYDHAIFCPWLDHQFQFFAKSLTVEHYQRNSMAWLEVADEVWVLPGSENSKGTQAEIKRARELGIPVKPFNLWQGGR